jgi:GntR family transcriptional regulator, transcriptional repressor for pyruvate dehydrogenase complex
METVKRQRLSEVIAGRIKHFIITNQLKPGDRLPTEVEMAARFGVSRVSVREATTALGFLGVLNSAPRRGLTVGNFDIGRAAEHLGFLLLLEDHPKMELLNTRIIIETGAMPYVAQQMAEKPAIYDQLTALNDRSKQDTPSDEWIENDIAFHRALIAASGLGPLVAFNDLLQVFFDRFRGDIQPASPEERITSHQNIIDALHRKDIDGACDLMRHHFDYYRPALKN